MGHAEGDRTAHLWAARSLLLLGEQPDLNTIEALRVDLSPGIPEALRDVVVRFWVRCAHQAQPGTDVRWLIEGLLREGERPDVTDEHATVMAALRREGLTAGEPVDAGTWNEQGWGTYSVVEVENARIWLSDLTRYALIPDPEDESTELWLPRIQRALQSVGWTFLEEQMRRVLFPGLKIYFFGRDKVLPLHKLLFYYQD
ncbi:hypothetical protein [Deinococcus hopiensis]|uniref:Uncharacterized protein n=1 Tax=Deinococcus hopiensis KR-140 TaxID=695939 RepID=A0A1W1UJY6_9DEIO|nr:hypothetical protein [Deinococcus hopiensis]SMB81359.1 hypothetical protein SAMN00790413_04553 [Deinococcus hopiensis KR-140]